MRKSVCVRESVCERERVRDHREKERKAEERENR